MRLSRLSILALAICAMMMSGVSAAPTTSIPMPQPAVSPPAPVVPVAIKRRWRVLAKMWFRDGTFVPVYITWYGFPSSIDWPTAAVCQYNPWNRYDYRFWSPWERWGTTFEVIGPPVDDMNTPLP